MVQSIQFILFYATAGLGMVALFSPIWLMWRAVVAAGLCFAAMLLARGRVHWSDRGLDYEFTISLYWGFWLGLAAGIAIRLLIASQQRILSKDRILGPGWVWLDAGLLDLAGLVAGTILFAQLAWLFAGSGLGAPLDWAVAILGVTCGLALTVLALWKRSLWPVFPAATLGVVGFFALWGAGQKDRILDEIEVLAGDAPHCVINPTTAVTVTDPADLGFLSLYKSTHHRHLAVNIAAEEGTWQVYWSIRRQRFVDGGRRAEIGCLPRPGFSDALASGALAGPGFVLGPNRYDFGAEPTMELVDGGIEISRARPDLPQDAPAYAQTLTLSPWRLSLSLVGVPADDTPEFGLTVYRSMVRATYVDGAETEPTTTIDCLNGTADETLCWITFYHGGLSYFGHMRAGDIAEWRRIRSDILAIWDGYIATDG
ncbi:MAG: hypothetical protein AAF689_06345 [Pseudomonadota bacterium]